MDSNDNIFQPPQSAPSFREDAEANPKLFVSIESFGTLAGLFGFFGAILGFAGGIGATFLADFCKPYLLPAIAGPVLPHGAQWVFYTLPVCAMLGIVMGCGIAAAYTGRALPGLAAVLSLSLLAAGLNLWLWQSQISRFGRNEAELPIYYPPFMLSIVAWLLSIWLGRRALLTKRHASRAT